MRGLRRVAGRVDHRNGAVAAIHDIGEGPASAGGAIARTYLTPPPLKFDHSAHAKQACESCHLGGRAHVYNSYSTADGWTGVTYFWFQDVAEVTLGGNTYTVWGANHYDAGPASVNVWVGDDPPLHLTPEPGTFALAVCTLVPLGLRRLRRT